MKKSEEKPLAPEATTVSNDTDAVKCDGGNKSLGHPAVYYRFDDKTSVTCGYCGHIFVKAA